MILYHADLVVTCEVSKRDKGRLQHHGVLGIRPNQPYDQWNDARRHEVARILKGLSIPKGTTHIITPAMQVSCYQFSCNRTNRKTV